MSNKYYIDNYIMTARDKIIDHIFPTYCISCKQTGNLICKECANKLMAHPYMCPVCHRKSDYFQVCRDCKISGIEFDGLDIVFYYDKIIKKLLLQMKYYHKYSVVDFFINKLTLNTLSNPLLSELMSDKDNTIITYVPSHRWRRYMVKWYNQSMLLAKAFAKQNNLGFVHLFTKTRHTKTQAGLDRRKRLTNLEWSFVLNPDIDISNYKNILILDDVTTTWSTINQLAKILRTSHPTLKIRWVVIGRNNR